VEPKLTQAIPLYRRFRTLLIANRGEIACRIIRSAKRLGLRTVAVYSEADENSLHVTMADDAILLGPARASESYLNMDRIIAAARATGAEAIHPGYGFLSESAEFARRCHKDGLVFVGPTAEMIHAMGSKSGSKVLMEAAGVPLVPGYHGDAQDISTLTTAATKIGYPVLIKASAGGGGRGMRIVCAADQMEAAMASAKREALAAFGDDRLLVEKYVENPRHIEVQVIGDSHGNLVSLFERECTLQRRHQKIIEEAPSPTLDSIQREAVCAAARKAAAAVKYVGAGTIEFVSDGKDVFFIEMNTRLQVEHPVTELITGIDLVEWQLRVAFGEPLPLAQDQIRLNGHAIEARIYAENPARDFMPSVGRISTWRLPEESHGLRIDAGYRAGDTVSPNYDAMLAKMIAWAPTREGAVERLYNALDETDIRGIENNVVFLSALINHRSVRANAIDTGFIERELTALTPPQTAVSNLELCTAVAAILRDEQRSMERDLHSPWQVGWAQTTWRKRLFIFSQGQVQHKVTLQYGQGPATILIDGREIPFASQAGVSPMIDLNLHGAKTRVVAIVDGRDIYVRSRNGRFDLHWADLFGVDEEDYVGQDRIVAPLPGTIVAVMVKEGELIDKGAPILTLEVMKMEQTLHAPFDGLVKSLKYKVGETVQEGAELAEIEPREA
jgi:3-methylcrotonyl-CoA carboxylase alpha subunit